MRSNDEFIRLIHEKETEYYNQSKKKIKNVKVITASLAACFVLCLVLVFLPFINSDVTKCDYAVKSVPERNENSSDQINSDSSFNHSGNELSGGKVFADGLKSYERYYTNPDKIKKFTDFISNLSMTEVDIDEVTANKGVNLTVVVKYDDGSSHTYFIFADRYLKIDNGNWQKMQESDADGLQTLVSSTKSD